MSCSSLTASGYCPSFDTMFRDGLCPKIPLKNAGIRIEPPMSEPSPKGDAAAAWMAPSPPLEPPTMRFVSYGLHDRPWIVLTLSHLERKVKCIQMSPL